MNPEILAAIKAAINEGLAPVVAQVQAQGKQLSLITNPPSLEDVANMSDEQLADLGLTPADVQEALETYEREMADNPDAQAEAAQATEVQAGKDAAAKAPTGTPGAVASTAPVGAPATGAVAVGLAALQKELTEFKATFVKAKADSDKKEVEVLFADTEKKVTALVEENARLNEVIKTSGRPLSAGTTVGDVKYFSAGADKGKFEKLVQFHVDEKKVTRGVAFAAIVKEDPDAYQDYLVRLGVAKPNA